MATMKLASKYKDTSKNCLRLFSIFSTDADQVAKTDLPACYVSKKPLDVLSDWACVECGHTINHERIRELEEIAFKIVNSGLNYCNRWYGIYY